MTVTTEIRHTPSNPKLPWCLWTLHPAPSGALLGTITAAYADLRDAQRKHPEARVLIGDALFTPNAENPGFYDLADASTDAA